MLTGKCKEDFEKWFMITFLGYSDPGEIEIERRAELNLFYAYDFSMQYGVYVDFFDSVGIYLQVRTYFDKYEWKVEQIDTELRRLNQLSENVATRFEARQKSIEKANEIYNSNV